MLGQLHQTYSEESKRSMEELKNASVQNRNIFEALMEATKYCSIGQITAALFEVGGQYRRNM
jgi:methylmalonyl-CoA mutase